MEFTELTADQLDEVISESEREVARARARQLGAIREQRRRKTHESDGYRSIIDWVSARADVSHQSARRLCWTASRLEDHEKTEQSLASGDITFDRAEQLSRLPDADPDDHDHLDISQIRRKAALYRKVTRREESEAAKNQHLNLLPDEDCYNIWGALDGWEESLPRRLWTNGPTN